MTLSFSLLLLCSQFASFTQPVPLMMLPLVWNIADDDLVARMILSEAGGRILTEDGQIDAIGMAWVALNRIYLSIFS